jgi:hypothetical protein
MKNPYPVKVKRQRGRPAIGPRPAKDELVRLYVSGRLSLRETAAALKVSKDIARAALADYGIKRRARTTKRAILTDIPLSLLEANIKAEGLRAHARTLGVGAATLAAHVKRMRADK